MSWLSWLFWWRPPCVRRVVIVNLKDDPDTALRGVLLKARGPWLVLVQVAILKPMVPPTDVTGEILIERRNVSFLQVPT